MYNSQCLTESEFRNPPWYWAVFRWWADVTWHATGNTYRWYFKSPEARSRMARVFEPFATVTAEGEIACR